MTAVNRLPSVNQSPGVSDALTQDRLVSYSAPAASLDLLDFLRQAHGQERFYWESGADDIAFAGVGIATELTAWGADRFTEIQRQATGLFDGAVVLDSGLPHAGPRLFGGFAFRDDFAPDNAWSIFPPANFILPHYQLVKIRDRAWLTINAQIGRDEDPDTIIPQLRQALMARNDALANSNKKNPIENAPPTGVDYPLSYDAWRHMIETTTHRIKRGDLQKAVLSRISELRFAERVDVDSALAYLDQTYANSYRFLYEPRPFHAFFGATPELLGKVEGASFETMALAGSMRRGATKKEDDVLGGQLLNDPKERHEHDLVVQTIRERLQPVASQMTIPDHAGLYKLQNIQHIYTPITGVLSEPSGVLPIIERLHPTPALGGKPRETAMQLIGELETAPRGWYAGPIGWVDHKLDGMFSVAIRSAVSQDKRVWLYAGAGIVEQSIPEREWRETSLKFQPLLNALGVRESLDDTR